MQRLPEVTTYTLHSKKITSSVRLVFLADLHQAEYGKDNIDLIRQITGLRPDAVILGGDFVNAGNPDVKPSVSLIRGLVPVMPVYSIYGNNEQGLFFNKRTVFDTVIAAFWNAGAVVLSNEAVTVDIKGQKLFFCGIWSFSGMSLENTEKMLLNCRVPKDIFSILISHHPDVFDHISGYAFDLVLSGHLHGGHWRLPGGQGIWAPGCSFFPKYCGGYYHREHHPDMIVSRGLGDKTSIPRIHNQHEIVVIDLLPA